MKVISGAQVSGLAGVRGPMSTARALTCSLKPSRRTFNSLSANHTSSDALAWSMVSMRSPRVWQRCSYCVRCPSSLLEFSVLNGPCPRRSERVSFTKTYLLILLSGNMSERIGGRGIFQDATKEFAEPRAYFGQVHSRRYRSEPRCKGRPQQRPINTLF